MRSHIVGLAVLAALVLAIILAIAPRTTLITNVVSGEVYGIDVTGFTATDADGAPAQRYARH
jgi:hypothetical protein